MKIKKQKKINSKLTFFFTYLAEAKTEQTHPSHNTLNI
jgi:hypothetical protein